MKESKVFPLVQEPGNATCTPTLGTDPPQPRLRSPISSPLPARRAAAQPGPPGWVSSAPETPSLLREPRPCAGSARGVGDSAPRGPSGTT